MLQIFFYSQSHCYKYCLVTLLQILLIQNHIVINTAYSQSLLQKLFILYSSLLFLNLYIGFLSRIIDGNIYNIPQCVFFTVAVACEFFS